MKTKPLVLLLFTALVVMFPQAHGLITPGTYNISLTSDHVSVNIYGTFYQNVTTLPPLAFTFSGLNSSTLAQDLNSSLQQLDPHVWVRDPVLLVSSNGTLLTYSLLFSVFGAIHSYPGGSSSVDVDWRSFNIQEDIQVNGVYFNFLGKHDLGTSLASLAQKGVNPTRSITVSFKLGGTRVSPLQIQTMAPSLNLLDFSSLSDRLDSWSQGFHIDSLTTSWTKQTGFDILATTQLTEPLGNVLTIPEKATYTLGVTLMVPGFASLQGNLIYFGTNILDILFAAVILATLATLLVAFVADRRLTQVRRFRSKPK